MAIQYKQINQHHILYQDSLSTKTKTALCDLSLFDPAQLSASGKIYKTAKGRGNTYFVECDSQHYVLRHYWRGGLIGKLLADRYWWLSLKKTRPYQELSLLEILAAKDLPAPKPIAANIVRAGVFYRADILTAAIENSQSLVQRLQNPLPDKLWQDIGATIKRFHNQGIYHDDLNAHNILLDGSDKVFVIDFDKGKLIPAGKPNWQEKNLNRLLRSLNKEKNLGKITSFTEADWQNFLRGYQQDN
jgi:3-deoxy-D-manno-octulosonic acid kinase